MEVYPDLEYIFLFTHCQTCMPIQTLFENPILFFLWIGAVVLALTIHEFAHALAGSLQGDDTAEDHGRLTLNPLPHIDWLGFGLLVLVGFGWAKPTPYNPYNLKYKKFGGALIALAGPISNIIAVSLLTLTLWALQATMGIDFDNLMVIFFIYLIEVNLLLAIFNVLPIPPLDGSKVLFSFIQDTYPQVVLFLQQYQLFLLLGVIFFGGSFLSAINSFFFQLIQRVVF